MTEDIIILGASGAIGRRAVRDLLAAGHRVAGVASSEHGRRVLEGLGAEALRADVYDEASLARAFAGRGIVVNLLTRIPPVEEMALPAAWEENDRLRREASAAIAAAAHTAGAHRLVQESLVLLYADGAGAWLDEDAPLDPRGAPAAARDAERNAAAFPGAVVVLRFGLFCAPDSDQTQAQIGAARRGISPFLAPQDAYLPFVWLDDAAAAVVTAVTAPPGTYNVVDDDPRPRAAVDAALAAAVGRDRLLAPLGQAPTHRGPAEPMSRSLRVANGRLKAAGWAPAVRAGVDGWALAARDGAAAA